MKIFNNNLNNNSKTIPLKKKLGDLGKIKYLPSFSKEWKNIIYSYNKTNLKNIPVNNININKIIKSYFNLYFKNYKYLGSKKFILLKRRRKFLRRIFVSNAEIKHTNDKAKITLYTVNREKKILKEKYLKINKKVSKNLVKRYILLYKSLYNILKKNITNSVYKYKYDFEYTFLTNAPNFFFYYKLKYFKKFIILKDIYLKNIWSIIVNKYKKTYLQLLRKYDLMYSLNQNKFNRKILLPILSKILKKILRKKVEYNIINMKSIAYNTDLFTHALALKFKAKKRFNLLDNTLSIFNRAHLPIINKMKQRTLINNIDLGNGSGIANLLGYKCKDLKIISYLNNNNLDKLLVAQTGHFSTKQVHDIIYNSIDYKNMGGIRIEVKGRLTKRYRADRSIYLLKWKGGLKNVNSSSKRLSSVLFRGNTKSNVSYSIFNSKRRIGAFAVKGWISGKDI